MEPGCAVSDEREACDGDHNPGGELREERFFYFFARNSLKSLDSAKQIKRNKSNFPFIFFGFLAVDSRVGCIQAASGPLLTP